MNQLSEIQSWYKSHCDGEWEHQYGIMIETIDNPGWIVKIDLQGTGLIAKKFDELKVNYDHDSDWIICKKDEKHFEAACGPTKLSEVLSHFLQWAHSEGDS